MPISIDPNEDGIQETETHGYLEFDNVTFAYPGETESPVLHNISFTAKPGETIAFIGSTGSGKSTLVQLIPRFYDVTLGKIKVDGVDVRGLPSQITPPENWIYSTKSLALYRDYSR